MPNFRQNSTVRNYLSRREQWRILLLVMSLGLVIVAMGEAAKSSNWEWLWAGAKQNVPQDETRQDQKVDTWLPPGEDLEPGVVRIAAPPPALPAGANEADFFPGVNIEFLKQVRDNEVAYYSPDEDNPQRKAWFNLLDILNRTDEAVLRKASTGKATFAQLYKQPNTYRGKLVTVEGYVKWAVPHAATKNDVGIEDIYELWVSVDREATVVQCLQLPKGFPIGNDVLAKVEITGFFYKKYAYRPHHAGEEARPDLKVAPVLLAKTVKWIPMEPAAEANGPSTEAIWAAVAGALAIALVFTWWVFSRNRRWGAVQLDRKAAAALDHLENVEMTGDVVVSIEAAMQQQDETPQ